MPLERTRTEVTEPNRTAVPFMIVVCTYLYKAWKLANYFISSCFKFQLSSVHFVRFVILHFEGFLILILLFSTGCSYLLCLIIPCYFLLCGQL